MPAERVSTPVNVLRIFSTEGSPMSVSTFIDVLFSSAAVRITNEQQLESIYQVLDSLTDAAPESMIVMVKDKDGNTKPELAANVQFPVHPGEKVVL